jgi:hypothetical protein
VILSGSIAASAVPASADSGSTIAAGILGATAGAMLGAAAVSAAPPPPPVVYAGPATLLDGAPTGARPLWLCRRLSSGAGLPIVCFCGRPDPSPTGERSIS